jgi:SAM-dependent methyltransferase
MKNKIGRWWTGRKQHGTKAGAWPLMEQGQYRSYRAVHPFDERFGVDTSGLLYDLPSGHAHDPYNNGYFAVAPSVFHGVMDAMVDRLGLDCRRFSFVDLGSGKGRALMLASDYPFRAIVGVELSPALDRIARANLARYAAIKGSGGGTPVSCLQGDATEFVWPTGPLLIYMWNAFTRPVMEQVFQNLENSLRQDPREVYVIYMHPELESSLMNLPWLLRLWREEFPMSDKDYDAWAFPTRAELCALYHANVGSQTKV